MDKPLCFIYPNPETLPAIPLALMLLGKAVSTPALYVFQSARNALACLYRHAASAGLGKRNYRPRFTAYSRAKVSASPQTVRTVLLNSLVNT